MKGILKALEHLFQRHRIVFWYDREKNLREEFREVALEGVVKEEICRNEFSLKYRMLRQERGQKFLLYHEGPPPEDEANWLLDVLLAQGEFRGDRGGILLGELGLDVRFGEVLRRHGTFFDSKARMEQLAKALTPQETPDSLVMKMLGICTGGAPRGDEVLLALLEELAQDKESKRRLVERCGLEEPLWSYLGDYFGYLRENPSLEGFMLDLFLEGITRGLGKPGTLRGDAMVLLRQWRDSRRWGESFRICAEDAAESLGIRRMLEGEAYTRLLELDLFSRVEEIILEGMAKDLEKRALAPRECSRMVEIRRKSPWFPAWGPVYEALESACALLALVEEGDFSPQGLGGGVQRYAREWYRVDQLYRRFWFSFRRAEDTRLLERLAEEVEKLYRNVYLHPLSHAWQQVLDGVKRWDASGEVLLQRDFYARRVASFLEGRKKIVVVISDALRFEAAQELMLRIRREDRYEAELEPMLGVIPSFTQLGMAALLPQENLELKEDPPGTVLADGRESQGVENRSKILQAALGEEARGMRAESFLALSAEDARGLVRDCRVLYLYHDRIDSEGSQGATEEGLFEAVEKALEELVKIIKKLGGANANNILVTADHGFLFRQKKPEESDFTDAFSLEGEVLYQDRRFLLGRGLNLPPGFWGLPPKALGLQGEMEALFPRSVQSLRLKGSGTRFLHGGTSLQEVVIPSLHVHRARQSDVETLEVEVLQESRIITSGQFSVVFFQTLEATEKRRGRRLRMGLYSSTGELLSDFQEMDFSFTSPEPRERQRRVRFILTRKAEEYNHQEIYLRLEEPVEHTERYREYLSVPYMLRRSMATDFDF